MIDPLIICVCVSHTWTESDGQGPDIYTLHAVNEELVTIFFLDAF